MNETNDKEYVQNNEGLYPCAVCFEDGRIEYPVQLNGKLRCSCYECTCRQWCSRKIWNRVHAPSSTGKAMEAFAALGRSST